MRRVAERASGGSLKYLTATAEVSMIVTEDSTQVDGIGGVLWDGTFVMNEFLEQLLGSFHPVCPVELHIIELGCGAGLTSLVLDALLSAGKLNPLVNLKITCTDRFTDLAAQNCASKERTVNVTVQEFAWGTLAGEKLAAERGKADIILGSEIMVLNKQQQHLIDTIVALSHPKTLTFLTADGATQESKYEDNFCQAMMEQAKLCYAEVARGSVQWEKDQIAFLSSFSAQGRLHFLHRSDKTTTSVPSRMILARDPSPCPPPAPNFARLECVGCERKPLSRECKDDDDEHAEEKYANLPSPPTPTPTPYKVFESHRVILFFAQSALTTCRNCNQSGFHSHANILNPPNCRYHPQLFVKRWHPAECKLSCGNGDGEGYYGGGTTDYAAEFWDCCGSENPSMPGCQIRRCEGYY